MDMGNPAIELTSRLIEVSVKNTAQIIYNRMNLAKQKSNDKETINALEEIINDLIADKNELIQITKCYEQEFIAQKISDSDIDYITTTLLPLLTSFVPKTEQSSGAILAIEALLSSETLKILQLLGFNYKEAIGIPLTALVAQAIQNQTNKLNSNKITNNRK